MISDFYFSNNFNEPFNHKRDISYFLDAGELIPEENLDVTKYKGTVPVYPQPPPSPFDPPGLNLLDDGKVNSTQDIILDRWDL